MGALFAVFWFMRRKMGGAESPGSRWVHVARLAESHARAAQVMLLQSKHTLSTVGSLAFAPRFCFGVDDEWEPLPLTQQRHAQYC